jgi:phage-related protein
MALGFLGRGVLLAGRVLMFTPIGRILGLIAMGAYWVYQNWASIYPRILKVWEIIKAVFNLGMDWIKTKVDVVWQTIKPVVDQVAGVMRGVYSAVTGWISSVYQWVLNSPVGKFVSGAVNFAKDVGGTVAGAYNSAKSFASNAGKNADAALNSGYAWAQDVNKGHSPNGSPYIASANAQPVQVQTSINLDGRKVAEVVSKHQSKELNRPATGGSRFDPTIGVPPVGMNYAK